MSKHNKSIRSAYSKQVRDGYSRQIGLRVGDIYGEEVGRGVTRLIQVIGIQPDGLLRCQSQIVGQKRSTAIVIPMGALRRMKLVQTGPDPIRRG